MLCCLLIIGYPRRLRRVGGQFRQILVHQLICRPLEVFCRLARAQESLLSIRHRKISTLQSWLFISSIRVSFQSCNMQGWIVSITLTGLLLSIFWVFIGNVLQITATGYLNKVDCCLSRGQRRYEGSRSSVIVLCRHHHILSYGLNYVRVGQLRYFTCIGTTIS